LTLHDAVKLCLEEASADAVGSKVEANNNDSRNEVDAARDARAVG
jgi:hypothetical protein